VIAYYLTHPRVGIASGRLLCDWTPMDSFEGVDDAG